MDLRHGGIDGLEREILLVAEVVVEGARRRIRRREQGLDAKIFAGAPGACASRAQAAAARSLASCRRGRSSLGAAHARGSHAAARAPRSGALRGTLARSLATRPLDEVVHHVAVLMLWAERDDLRIRIDPDSVAGRSVEQILGADCHLPAGRIGRGDLPTQQEAPRRAVAGARPACGRPAWCRCPRQG